MQSLTSNEEQAAFVVEGAAEEDAELVANRLEFFREGRETCEALRLAAEPGLDPKACREACERVSATWAQYQEQPGLLDPYLEEMVVPLIGAIGNAVRANAHDPVSALPNLHLLSSLLYLLTTVRGYKTVSRLFTHEAADLEPCLEAAEAEAEAARTEVWSTLYCLLLWLGMILLTPFDLQSIDSGGDKALGTRVLELGLCGLQSTSRIRDAAAWMLARYFQRRDVAAGGALQLFLEWTTGLWKAEGGAVPGPRVPEARVAFARCGALQAWNQALKTAPRAALRPLWPQVLGVALRGPTGQAKVDFGTSSALRKLRVTVCYRAGLVSLPPRLAPWRYMRGARSLLVNFASATGGAISPEKGSVGGDGAVGLDGTAVPARREGAAAAHGAEEEEEDDGGDDAPEEVEEVIELLLASLGDADTVVRWAAAKGVGRLTNRLSRDFGDQVLESLLERCFSFRETDKAWHGGCLALAELTRRGLLLPERLQAVVPLVCQALHFEQVSGNHAVGQHVRDAACYVCWAFARAYAPDILEPFVGEIASALIQVAVYDRDINCRRAAAAAVQENVGRQGTFPNGIEVVTIADYWTLSARRQAYLEVAPQLAALGEERYRRDLIDHLVDRKLQHQDVQIRLLAGQGLARLAERPSDAILAHLNGVVIPKLVARALEGAEPKPGAAAVAAPSAGGGLAAGTVQSRHGAVVGAAALTQALQELVSVENQTSLRNLVPALEKLRAYRGRGGEVVRQAACKLLCAVAGAVSWPFKDATSARYLQTVDECARHTTDAIQVAAADALCALAAHRFGAELSRKALGNYIAGLKKADETIAARRGYVLCIGALPPAVLREQCPDVLATLAAEAQGLGLPGGKDQEDPQTRQYAVLSLGRACFGMRLGGDELDAVVKALEAALQDYALDRRGDVGSWVREVAMEVIAALLQAQRQPESTGLTLPSSDTSTRLTALLLQQAVEKIDRLRERAFGLLYRLFCDSPPALGSGVDAAFRRVCHGEAYDLLSSAAGAGAELAAGSGAAQPAEGPAWPPAHCERLAAALRGAAAERARAAESDADNDKVGAAAALGAGGRGSVAIFEALAPLLACEAYRATLCFGLVVSVGGITEHIAKDAQRALLCYLQEDGAAEARADEIATELLRVFDQVGCKDSSKEARRVLAPLLCAAGVLLAEGWFPRGSAGALLERVLAAVRASKDIARLRASVDVLVGLLRWPGPARPRALAALLEFLGYSFPTVRQATARALYIRLLEEDGDLDLTDGESQRAVPAGRVAEVSELMSATPWSTDNEEALVSALHEVYAKLGLDLPAGGRSMVAPKKPEAPKKPRENEYADLVREHHY